MCARIWPEAGVVEIWGSCLEKVGGHLGDIWRLFGKFQGPLGGDFGAAMEIVGTKLRKDMG